MWLMTTKENPRMARCMKCGQVIPEEVIFYRTRIRYCPYCGELARGVAIVSRKDYEEYEV